MMTNFPCGQNVQLVKDDELQIYFQGNKLVGAWTVPIKLFPPPLILPPGCVILESTGDLRTVTDIMTYPSGYSMTRESNGFDAFVTFLHEKSKYSGPSTDGFLARDTIAKYVPSKQEK